MLRVVNMYLDHLEFCGVCINGRRYVCCSERYVVANECDEPTHCLVLPINNNHHHHIYSYKQLHVQGTYKALSTKLLIILY